MEGDKNSMIILQATIIGILCYVASIGVPWFFGITGGFFYLSRPLIAGTIIGAILGDLQQGIIIGAAIQMVYISHVMAGGGTSADLTFVSYPAIAIALLSNVETNVAIALAATIGVLGIVLFNVMLTTNIFWIHLGDKYLANGDLKGWKRANTIYPQLTTFAIRFIPSFLAVYLGAEYAQEFLNSFPAAVTSIMGVLGGLLPALGIALLLAQIMTKSIMVLYFLIGFICVSVLGINLLTLSIIGAFIAYIYYIFSGKDLDDEDDELSKIEPVKYEIENKVTSMRDIRKVFWTWHFFQLAAMNSERLQGTTFGYSLLPIFNKMYPNEADRCEAMKRHNVFFDTESEFGSIIIGVVAGLEEAKGHGIEVSDESITGIKTGLMGPMGGIGATLVMGVILPLLLSIGVSLSAGGSLLGPAFVTVVWLPGMTFGSYVLFMKGYKLGVESLTFLTGKNATRLTDAMTIIGIMAMGGLAASSVSLTVTAVYDTIVFQEMFDAIFIKLLPLIVTLISWLVLKKKKMSPIAIILAYLVLATVGVLLGIF